MYCNVLTATIRGLEVHYVRAEADAGSGMPGIIMVGYLAGEVRESRERIRTAVRSSGYQIPAKKITINLSPADIRKQGASFDLPIALGIMGALGYIEGQALEGVLILGELGLDGKIHPVRGVLPILADARKRGIRRCIVPKSNIREAGLSEGIAVYGAATLAEAVRALERPQEAFSRPEAADPSADPEAETLDFSDISGQHAGKRAAEIAAAGFHNILFIGPPGSGKTMLAKRIPLIMPGMTLDEQLEVSKIYSVAGLLNQEAPLMTKRPFREVHHTVTKNTLLGGGYYPSPGQMSLASGGTLFLDELPLFKREVLESLRQPMEDKEIRLHRMYGDYIYPANCIITAAMNPCWCGNYPDREKCRCTDGEVNQYLNRLSKPLLDRIDICVEVPRLHYTDIENSQPAESAADIRQRVLGAVRRQERRYRDLDIRWNSELAAADIRRFCVLGRDEKEMLRQVYDCMELSVRAYHKILKLARTIADLDDQEQIGAVHLGEALGYRSYEKNFRR